MSGSDTIIYHIFHAGNHDHHGITFKTGTRFGTLARTAAGTLVAVAATLLSACGVQAVGGDTGGVNTDVPGGTRGAVVVQSDYQSTNVSLIDWQGHVLSSSLVSSSSATAGLSTPLSGDVAVPTMAQTGAEIVLIDRFMTSVLTWIDVKSGQVTKQLPVATGFASNPHDYLLVSEGKAYVTRYGDNATAGTEPFDQGSDVLVVDPRGPSIEGRVDMKPAMAGEETRFLPRPDRMARARGKVWVLLGGYTRDFMASASTRLVAVDPKTDKLGQVLVLGGMHGCTGMAVAPGGAELMVACSGEFAGGSNASVEGSGLVRVEVDEEGKAAEVQRYPAKNLTGGLPLGFGVTYADAGHVFVTVFGRDGSGGEPKQGDRVLSVELQSGKATELAKASKAFMLGDVRCGGSQGSRGCYVTDAEAGKLRYWRVGDAGKWKEQEPFRVDDTIGLPPRLLGGW